jgi:hypothetical protein
MFELDALNMVSETNTLPQVVRHIRRKTINSKIYICFYNVITLALNLTLTSPTSGGRSVGIFYLRTKATEFLCYDVNIFVLNITSDE